MSYESFPKPIALEFLTRAPVDGPWPSMGFLLVSPNNVTAYVTGAWAFVPVSEMQYVEDSSAFGHKGYKKGAQQGIIPIGLEGMHDEARYSFLG